MPFGTTPPTKSSNRSALALATFCTLIVMASLAIPMYIIRPFRPQAATALALALDVRNAAPWISAACALFVVLVVIMAWKTSRTLARIILSVLLVLTLAGAVFSHVNIFEIMFHPYDSPSFESVAASNVDGDDKVLAISIAGQSHGYPIRTMGYHHIVNDTVGGVPIAATYCTLCHTGLVWSRILDGRTLHFRLTGINNGNALMRDEETGTVWQQSTGEAIFGPLKGRQLTLLHSNELTFALWKTEQPAGQVLKADAPYQPEYDPKDWEKHVESTHVVIDTGKSGIQPHELMLGVASEGNSRAYPIQTILVEKLIQDRVATQPILILVGPDQTSIRVFHTTSPVTFIRTAETALSSDAPIMQDAETGSQWNFKGCAVDGKSAGQCLVEIDAHKDYWFDWMNHHPASTVFKN